MFFLRHCNACLGCKRFRIHIGTYARRFHLDEWLRCKNLDKWLLGLECEFEKDFKCKDRKCLFENQDICSYQHFVTNEKGGRLRVTNVMILKEYTVHRAAVI